MLGLTLRSAHACGLALALLLSTGATQQCEAAARRYVSQKHAYRPARYRQPVRPARYWRGVRAAYPQARNQNVTLANQPPPNGVTDPSAPAPVPHPLKLLTREELLASDPEKLERAGRHIIVGFYNFADVRKLVEKRAIAGIFITSRNVRGRKIADVAADIRALQDIRRLQGLPRLIVAADQEGGSVSRLSPPLKLQPSLASILTPLKSDEEREKAVKAYAEVQARDLESLGVTMNFGPVVDLRSKGPAADGETRLYWRAIASDPFIVAKVAGWYCDTLTKSNIICTLKHFPGLGRATLDTHIATAEIKATEGQLELSDWVPFRRVMKNPGVATMLGHVLVDAIDKTTPASYSEPMIHNLMRRDWQNDGLLVTDDFSMGAVTRSRVGVGGAAIKAINAGVDLVLVSFSEKHYDTVMSALIEAQSSGEFDVRQHEASLERMKRYLFIEESRKTAQQN